MDMEREEKVKKLLEVARSLIGMPYEYGADLDGVKTPTRFDCSSFTLYCFGQIGIELPRSSILQATMGTEIVWPEVIKQGDLVFFERERGYYRHDLFPDRKLYIGHVAIAMDYSRIIHCCNNSFGNGVCEHSIILLPRPDYQIVLAKRIIQ